GRASTAGSLIRAPSTWSDTTEISWREFKWRMVHPRADATWNSTIPFSLNDGAEWAGRGLTAAARGGLSVRVGRLSMNVVPEIWRAQNAATPVLPAGDPNRKGFSSPWQVGYLSADLPLRFG